MHIMLGVFGLYKLLIVEDEYEIRNGLIKYFPWSKIGFEVVGEAEDGKQALEYAEKKPVDVMLCDIKLPLMSGIDVARELYNMKSKVKVVFLSAYREFEFAQKAIMYGVKNYVVKTATYDELVDAFTFIRNELDDEKLANSANKDHTYAENSDGLYDENDFQCVNEKIINKIKEYIMNNYKDANLEDASRLVYLSANYISKYFKKYTGLNFSDYLLQVRMNKAAELLLNIQYKTYEVSEMVGYSNSKNFARAFKSYSGKSPREYRLGVSPEPMEGNEKS